MRILNGHVGLNVEVDGTAGTPPVLVLHGILGSTDTWGWMVPRLVDRFRVLRLDFRGHGKSDHAPGTYLLSDYVSDAAEVCAQVAGDPCVVIGHSLGGAAAVGLAQQHPELVRGILLEDAPLSMPDVTATGADRNALLDGFALMREGIPQMQAAGMTVDEVAAVVAASPYAGGGTLGDLLFPEGVRNMGAAMLEVDAAVLDRVLDASMGSTFDPSRPIEVPVMAIAADPASPDAVTSQADLAQLEATSADARTRTLAGANHLIHDTRDQREAFWSLVDEFLDRV